jgi:Family of unknown function (DUF6186)
MVARGMTSRTISYIVWCLLAACFVTAVVVSLTTKRIPTIGSAIRSLVRRGYVQVICLVAWLWAGWHFFVRSSR